MGRRVAKRCKRMWGEKRRSLLVNCEARDTITTAAERRETALWYRGKTRHTSDAQEGGSTWFSSSSELARWSLASRHGAAPSTIHRVLLARTPCSGSKAFPERGSTLLFSGGRRLCALSAAVAPLFSGFNCTKEAARVPPPVRFQCVCCKTLRPSTPKVNSAYKLCSKTFCV